MRSKVKIILVLIVASAGLISCGVAKNRAASDSDTPVGPAITGAEPRSPATTAAPDPSLPPLPVEETGKVESLPSAYPESWILVDESYFFNMYGGKVIIMDAAEKAHAKRIKGLVSKNLIGSMAQSKTRGEFYVMETFHERGSRGALTDVLVIYDKSTLAIRKEIIRSESKRLTALPQRYAMSLSNDEKFLYVFNFSPAASVSVIDLETQEFVSEIGTPGCVLTYPASKRTIVSLCSNGGMLSTVIDDQGQLVSQKRLPPFFDTDKTPIFERPVIIDGIAYFTGFRGEVYEIDFRGEAAEYLSSWSMVTEEQKAENWRPSGLVLNDFDDKGLLYSIFQPQAQEGSQTQGGTQIWVFDVKARERVRVIDTPNWAISIAVTRGENPLLIVTNGELNLDVFNAQNGEHVQTLADFGNQTPLLVNKGY